MPVVRLDIAVNEVDRLLSQLDGLAGSFDFAAT
jgi:hypothetical protein